MNGSGYHSFPCAIRQESARKHVRKDDSADFGDQWVYVALDPDTKLVPSFVVGKRSSENTQAFMRDLRSRIADHRIQLTTDAYIFCRKAVEAAFGGDADFAQLTKLYGDYGQFGNERYSPPRITEVISKRSEAEILIRATSLLPSWNAKT